MGTSRGARRPVGAGATVADRRNTEVLDAAVELVGRTGAREMQIGYLHDDVPVAEAGWWAHAQLRGARIMVENHRGPDEAAEALAVKLLTGGMCTHCRGLIALRDDGAVAYAGSLADGSEMTERRARSMSQCRWRRQGSRWVRGCVDTHPERRAAGPNRAERRRSARRRGGEHRG